MAALTRAPWAKRLGLYYELLDHNARTADFVRFPREIHAQLHRPLILVWDRLPAHRSAARQLLNSASKWLEIEWLPAYAPELDPVEDVWNQCKYSDLANVIPEDIYALHKELDKLLKRYRHEPIAVDRRPSHSSAAAFFLRREQQKGELKTFPRLH